MGIDYFQKRTDELIKKKLFLFDMDGTIYEENRLFDGALELLQTIAEAGGRYVFITNNSSKSVNDYVKKVNALGIKANAEHFFTSAQATILYLKKNFSGQRVYCQGTHSLVRELAEAEIDVTDEVDDASRVVLVGFDTELTSAKLRKTCEMLTKDIAYLATNPDLACPVSFGFIPDCGSICQMLENATGRKPIYIGKPEPTMISIVMQRFGSGRSDTVVVGDRLYTDIAAGRNAGVTTICVLTGETTEEEIQNSGIKPSFTFGSVKDIAACLAEKQRRL